MAARALIIAALAALTLAGVALLLVGRARRLGLVPLGELIEAAGSSVPGRLAVALGWAWLGWHLLVR